MVKNKFLKFSCICVLAFVGLLIAQEPKTIKGQEYTTYAGFPLCTEVLNKFEDEYGPLDRKAIEEANAPLGEETKLNLVKHDFGSSSGVGCFIASTAVEVLVRTQSSNGGPIWRRTYSDVYKSGTVSMDTLSEINVGFQTPFILSSTLAMAPDHPEYHIDCWAEVLHYYTAEVPHGKKITTVGVANGLQHFTFEVTDEHRFYAYVGDLGCPEQDMNCDWVSAAMLDPKAMRLYFNSHGQQSRLTFVGDYKVTDKSWWGLFEAPKTVYNFATETHTYYVGPRDNRVLVHNTY